MVLKSYAVVYYVLFLMPLYVFRRVVGYVRLRQEISLSKKKRPGKNPSCWRAPQSDRLRGRLTMMPVSKKTLAVLSCVYSGMAFGIYWIPSEKLRDVGL